MKKLFVCFMCVLLSISLFACKGGNDATQAPEQNTEAPAGDATDAPEVEVTDAPEEEATDVPEEDATEEPSDDQNN